MADLFIAQLGPHGNDHKVSGIYATVISFEARLAILDRLMLFSNMTEEEHVFWTKLSHRMSKLYKRRHRIAHFTMVSPPDGERKLQPLF